MNFFEKGLKSILDQSNLQIAISNVNTDSKLFSNDVHRREQMIRSLPLGMLCPLEKCKKIVISYHLTF